MSVANYNELLNRFGKTIADKYVKDLQNMHGVDYVPGAPVLIAIPAVVKASSTDQTVSISAAEKRQQEKNAFNGWSNIPEVRALQQDSWNIYVSTGQWNTEKQKQNHERAEEVRMFENPTYKGSAAGPSTAQEAAKIALPTMQFVTANRAEGAAGGLLDAVGSTSLETYAKLGIYGLGALLIVSLFRR